LKISLKPILAAAILLGTLAVVPLAYSKMHQSKDMNGMPGQHKSQMTNMGVMQDQILSMSTAQDMMGGKMPDSMNMENHQKMMGNRWNMMQGMMASMPNQQFMLLDK